MTTTGSFPLPDDPVALTDAEATVSDEDAFDDGPDVSATADDVPDVADEPASEDAAAQGPVTAEQQTPFQTPDPDQTRMG